MKYVSIAAALALSASALGAASTSTPDRSAQALLAHAIAAPSTVSYIGVVEVTRVGSDVAQVSVYRIEHLAPDLTRRAYTAPSSLAGDATVTRGKESFSIDVKRHRVVEEQDDAADDRVAVMDNYRLLQSNYRAQLQTPESFDGRQTVGVLLINKYTARPTMLVRIDTQSKLVLDKQEFAAGGSLLSETRFESVQYPSNVPSADFALPAQYPVVKGPNFEQPSEDVARVVRSAGFDARGPTFLPHGFAPVEGSLMETNGVRTVHLLYSDGIRTVSLFENAGASAVDMTHLHPQSTSVAGQDAQYAQDGATELLAWSDGNLHCALVGELDLSELQRIAASIAP
jgi:negative regulator of sigma E activity